MDLRGTHVRRDQGAVLVLALLLLIVATLVGVSSLSTTNFAILISGNSRVSQKAFFAAEAGINEFLGRFRNDAVDKILDGSDPSDTTSFQNWRLFLATNPGRASGKEAGYRSSDLNHHFVQSVQTQMDFCVIVQHKPGTGTPVAVPPMYVATSHGYTEEGGHRIVEVEVVNVHAPGALYSKAPVRIHGASTIISGMDVCGGMNRPGIITTTNTIEEMGNPGISGMPPSIVNSSLDLPLEKMVESLSVYANCPNCPYTYNSNQTLSGYSDDWGIPVYNGAGQPLTYPEGPMNIVYFNMGGNKTLKLTGGSHGAGILLVNGNLEINGGFTWYGVIIVTGAIDYTGGGEKNVTGAILAGETTIVEVDVGGNANILYCGRAAGFLKSKMPPFIRAQWREVFAAGS